MFKKLVYTLIFFVCILASCFLTSSVFADSSNSFTYHNNIIDKDVEIIKPLFLPEDYIYTLLIYYSSDGISYGGSILFSNFPILVGNGTSAFPDFAIPDGGVYLYSFYSQYLSSHKFTETLYDLSNKTVSSFQFHKGPNTLGCGIFNVYTDYLFFGYSNYDVYTSYDNTLVFQKAPLLTGQIATSMTSIDFSTVLMEVLEMLPIVLIVLIGVIALMKAIKLLYSIFRNV